MPLPRFVTIVMFAGSLACLGLSGCSEAKYGEVTGRVTLDGKPMPNIAVRFQHEAGTATIAKTDANGNYTLRFTMKRIGAPVGQHKVTIFTPQPESEETDRVAVKELIPAKYNKKSTEVREVKPGPQVIDFDLVSN